MAQYVCFFVVSSAFYTCHRFQNDMTNAFDRAKQQEMALALLVQKEIKMPKTMPKSVIDIFIIGGGINGCGIARDAAGRGLSVELAEMNDLASATSSASTKLLHGGLRYLEYFKLRLVREALIERETLLKAMPHISRPMRFVLPYHKDQRFETSTPSSRLLTKVMPWMRGRRPAWIIRFGLLLYDYLGSREILPRTSTIDLRTDVSGDALNDRFTKAFEYSDCWVDDSRLVVLNARDAEIHGAKICTRKKVVSAKRKKQLWHILTEDKKTGAKSETWARCLVNTAGPWAGDIIADVINLEAGAGVRLVRGSHIVVKKLFDHDKSYFFQGEDGRIIFAIPYETNFTLIGTTDVDHHDMSVPPVCTPEEKNYLCKFASKYFKKPITADDVVWSYSGVRPLYDDGPGSASAATRDYVLKYNDDAGAPVINVFGGKITTYRKLAEHALALLPFTNSQATKTWTCRSTLPGGDFGVTEISQMISTLKADHIFLDDLWAKRLIQTYGSEAKKVLKNTKNITDLGQDFGATLMELEVLWLMEHEFAQTAEDVVWRRTKLGLLMDKEQILRLDEFMKTTNKSHSTFT